MRALLLQRFGLLGRLPVVLAPRGEFAHGSLAQKTQKKKSYLAFARALGLARGVVWHATSVEERADILRIVGSGANVRLAPNPIGHSAAAAPVKNSPKEPGRLRLVFLSRVGPVKNLHFALALLSRLSGEVSLDIYGPLDDEDYWNVCQREITRLPPSVRVSYRGPLPHEHVARILSNYDFLILPSLGESFGHVIVEALAAGSPVLVSERTPWRNLAAHNAGWDLPLDDPARWVEVLQLCADLTACEYDTLTCGALRFARTFAGAEAAQQVANLFDVGLPTTSLRASAAVPHNSDHPCER